MGAGCSNEPLSPIRFETNIVGLRKITTDWETLQPGERATKSRSAVNEDSGTPTIMSIIACLAPESGAARGHDAGLRLQACT